MVQSKTDIALALAFLNVLASAYFMLAGAFLSIYLQGQEFSFHLLWWVSSMASIATMLAVHLEDQKIGVKR